MTNVPINFDKKREPLFRCPKCKKENYALNVSIGICTWCPYQNPLINHGPKSDVKEIGEKK